MFILEAVHDPRCHFSLGDDSSTLFFLPVSISLSLVRTRNHTKNRKEILEFFEGFWPHLFVFSKANYFTTSHFEIKHIWHTPKLRAALGVYWGSGERWCQEKSGVFISSKRCQSIKLQSFEWFCPYGSHVGHGLKSRAFAEQLLPITTIMESSFCAEPFKWLPMWQREQDSCLQRTQNGAISYLRLSKGFPT